MSKYSVSPQKEADLEATMRRLGVSEGDLIEKFIRGSGPGGQKINKTSVVVYLKHIPTGIEVKCQASRSQSLNRFLARRELCEQIAKRVLNEKTKREQAAEKIRRQKRRRSRRSKEKMVQEKRHRGEIKKGRSKGFGDD